MALQLGTDDQFKFFCLDSMSLSNRSCQPSSRALYAERRTTSLRELSEFLSVAWNHPALLLPFAQHVHP